MRRVVAAIAAVWLVGFGVLGARHERSVAHFVDAATGQAFHAVALVGGHTSKQSDVHRADGAIDHDACWVASVLHQPARASVAASTVARIALVERTTDNTRRREPGGSARLYRVAPKTSPPASV